MIFRKILSVEITEKQLEKYIKSLTDDDLKEFYKKDPVGLFESILEGHYIEDFDVKDLDRKGVLEYKETVWFRD